MNKPIGATQQQLDENNIDMKYKIPKCYWWYFPDEDMKVSTSREPTYFRRFVMWLMHNAEFVIEYKEVDTQNIKQYQREVEI